MSGQKIKKKSNSIKNHPANSNSSYGDSSAGLSVVNWVNSQRKFQDLDILPVNLLQDTWKLKIDSFPIEYQNILQDLTKKVASYHINFFSPKIFFHKSGDELQLTCNLCNVTLPVVKIQNHVHDQKHLRNLAEKAHFSKLKFSKPQVAMEPAADLNAEARDQHRSHFDGSSKNAKAAERRATQTLIECLKSEDKRIGEELSCKLKYEIINFKPTYEYDKLYFSCKICWLKLLPEDVETHIQTEEHMMHLRQKFFQGKQNSSEYEVSDPESRGDNRSPIKVKKIIASTGKPLHEREKKIIMSFGNDADKILESFELTYYNGNQLNFICYVCRLCLYPKYVRSHLNGCSGVRNLMKNLCLVYFEDLNSMNKGILNKLVDRLGDRLIFLQLYYKFGSNKLQFFCHVCHLVSTDKDVEHHVHSKMHKKKLQIRPYGLKVESLNEPNKLIVKKITDSIKERITDFKLLHKIGTEKLHFYCKLCQRPVSVDEVELHAKLSQHLSQVLVKNCITPETQCPPNPKLVPQHPTPNTSTELANALARSNEVLPPLTETKVSDKVSSFTARLNEKDRQKILDFGQDAERILNSFEMSHKNGNRLNFICNVCKLCLYPKYVLSHLNSCSGVKNLLDDLCLVFLQDLNSMNKAILNKLIYQLNNRLIFLQLYYKLGTNRLKFFCQLCSLILTAEDIKDHVFSVEHEKNLEVKSFSLKFESLNQINQLIVNKISTEIKERMTDFNLLYKIGTEELLFYCKLCRSSLSPEKVKDHVKLSQHLNHISASYDDFNQLADQRSFKHDFHCTTAYTRTVSFGKNPERKEAVPFSTKMGVSEKVSLSIQHFNQRDKEIILDFGQEAEKILDSFIRKYDNSDRLNFICKICKLSLVPKDVKSHFHNCTGIENIMKNFQFVKLEDLNAENATLVKNLCNLYDSKLYVFQLLLGSRSNDLYFFCKACNLVLGLELVEDHILVNIHVQNLLSNPPRIAYQSLSKTNQRTVKDLAAVIRNRISDFNFVYKIGTEELQFYCKVCHVLVCPEKVKNHVKWDEHMKHVIAIVGNSYGKMDKIPSLPTSLRETSSTTSEPSSFASSSVPVSAPLITHQQNFSPVSFDSLSETQQKLVKFSIGEEDYKYFEFLLTLDSNKLHLKCKLCDLTVECPLILNHLLSPDHDKNGQLNNFFDNFISLEESSKSILRNLFTLIGSEVKSFLLLPFSDQRRHKIKCKICDLCVYLNTIDSEWLAHHLQSHTRTIKEVDINCAEASIISPANNSKFVASNEQTVQKVETGSCFLSAPSKINTIARPLNVVKNKSDNDNITGKNSSTNCKPEPVKKLKAVNPMPTQEDNTLEPFVCLDCNTNINFKTMGDNGHLTKTLKGLFIRCHGKSSEIALSSLRKLHSTKDAEPLKPALGVLSELDKQVFKELIDKIGFEMKDFDLMLEPISNELRFKCKFCLFIVRPESMESHIKTIYHLKYSKIADIQSLGFESLSASGKETVKNLYSVIGNGIRCLEVESPIHFVCKPCTIHMSPDDVVSHFSSKEHRLQVSHSLNATRPSSFKFQPMTHYTGSRNIADETSGKQKSQTHTSLNSRKVNNVESYFLANPSMDEAEPVTEIFNPSTASDNNMNLVKKAESPKSTTQPAESSSHPRKMAEDSDNSFEVIDKPRLIPKNPTEEVFYQSPQTSSSDTSRDPAVINKRSPSSSSSTDSRSIFSFRRRPSETVSTSKCSSNIFPGVVSNPHRSFKGIHNPKPVFSSQHSSANSSGLSVSSPQSTLKEIPKPEPVTTTQSQHFSPSSSNLANKPQNHSTSPPQVIKPQYSSNNSSSGGSKLKSSDKNPSKDSCSVM